MVAYDLHSTGTESNNNKTTNESARGVGNQIIRQLKITQQSMSINCQNEGTIKDEEDKKEVELKIKV